MKKLTTLIAIPVFALMLGACASTNDTDTRPEHTTESNNNPTEIPSATERQDDIAYTDISESASTKEVVTTETQVPVITSSVENPPAPLVTTETTMTSGTTSTTVDNTATLSTDTTDTSTTLSGTTSTSTSGTTSGTTSGSMTSSSTLTDTTDDDDDETATASRTRMRKD